MIVAGYYRFTFLFSYTLEALYKTVHYKMISDIRWFKSGPQKFCTQTKMYRLHRKWPFTVIFLYNLKILVWMQNCCLATMAFALDPSNSVIFGIFSNIHLLFLRLYMSYRQVISGALMYSGVLVILMWSLVPHLMVMWQPTPLWVVDIQYSILTEWVLYLELSVLHSFQYISLRG